jgi:hypothetical protein
MVISKRSSCFDLSIKFRRHQSAPYETEQQLNRHSVKLMTKSLEENFKCLTIYA